MATQGLYFIPAPLQNKNLLETDSKDSTDSTDSTHTRPRTTWDDLLEVNISKNDVFEMFQSRFGQKPNDVYLNEGICIQYGYLCHNVLGEVSFQVQSTKTITNVAVSKKISNDTSNQVDVKVSLKATEYKSASVTVTKSSSLSFGSKISVGSETLGIAAEFSTQFTFGNSVGSTSSNSTAIEVADLIDVHLEPNSKAQAELETQWTQMKENFTIPLTVSGLVGAAFGNRVEGHYFWFMHLPSDLDTSLTGLVDAAYNIKGNINVTDL